MPGLPPSSSSNAADDEIDINSIDFSEIEAKHAPQVYNPLSAAIVIDGAPVVGEDRKGKLLTAIRKAFNNKGLPFDPEQVDMPMAPDANSELKSKGFMFALLPDAAVALHASRAMDGYAFDKKHTFTVRTFDEIDELQTLEPEWKEPEKEAFKEGEHLRDWLSDKAGRDQVITHRGDTLQVGWFNRTGVIDTVHTRERWSESYVVWSRHGTMLATLHTQGVALWGGPSFERLLRLPHMECQYIDFSPNENYLVTWSPRPLELPPPGGPPTPFTADDEGNHIVVWEISTGRVMRTFPMLPHQTGANDRTGPPRKIVWPMFKWSSDDKYLARITPGQQISIYQTPEMGLLDKKSVKVEGVVDFEWRPMPSTQTLTDEEKANPKNKYENMLAYWTPDISNRPARVSIMSVPSREIVRSKNLFNVADCRLHWQCNGDYLCVKVDRYTKANAKTKKATFCSLELFRIKEKGTPVQTVEIKDMVIAFAWEPKGDRFAMITTNDPNFGQPIASNVTIKTSVEFYRLEPKKGDFHLLKTIEGKSANTIFWSPKGRHVIFVTLGSSVKCDLEFFDLDLDPAGEKNADDLSAHVQSISNVEHFGMTRLEWDPSGRYVATIGSMWDSSVEPGYRIWDFRGREIVRQGVERFKEFIWRPRPATLLSKEQIKNIRKNLREYSKKFEEIDEAESANVSQELIAHRRRLLTEWDSWRVSVKNELDALRKESGRQPPLILQNSNKEDETETIEEWVEEFLDENEIVIEDEA